MSGCSASTRMAWLRAGSRKRGVVVAVAIAAMLPPALAGAAGTPADSRSPSLPPPVIAFTQVSGHLEHIWTMNVDTLTRRQLTRGRYGESSPSWAPGGRRLVYAETRLHHVPGLAAAQIGPVIVIRDMARGSVRPITSGKDLDETPAWSPAGGRIAFVRTIIPAGNRTGPPEEIWTISTNGRDARQLTTNALSDIAPAWSPTGRALVYQRGRDASLRNWDLWTMRADGSGQRLLVRNGTRPAWSPNGRTIAFGRPTGQVRGCCILTDLMLIDSNGNHARLLVRNGGRPAWSPDGSRLVFQRLAGGHVDLWVINADGTGLRRLTSAPGDEFAAAWRR